MSKQRAMRENEEPATVQPYEPKPLPKEQQLAKDYGELVQSVCDLKKELEDAKQEETISRNHRVDVETKLNAARASMKRVHEELTKLVAP